MVEGVDYRLSATLGLSKNKNSDASARAAQAILKGADLLEASPNLGRPMSDETGRCEIVIPFSAGAYIFRCKLDDDAVVIIRVLHSNEQRQE